MGFDFFATNIRIVAPYYIYGSILHHIESKWSQTSLNPKLLLYPTLSHHYSPADVVYVSKAKKIE